MNNKKTSLISIVFYILIFFPYLKVIPLNTDTQPGALIFSTIIIFIYLILLRKKLPLKILLIIVVAVAAVVIFVINPSANAMRVMLGYLSLPIISLGSYFIISKDNGVNTKIIKTIIWIWFLIGMVQIIFNPNFGTIFVSDMRTTIDRGVTSLAAEPTYFGQMMYFLIFFVLIFFRKRKDKIIYISLCAISIFFLARSSMIVLILGFNVLIFLLNNLLKKWGLKAIKYMAISLVLIVVGLTMLNSLPESSRLVRTMNNISNEGLVDFFRKDASSNHRLSSIYFSFKGAFENFLIPNGFSNWKNYEIVQKSQSSFFWYGTTSRIMSMYGALLYELGVIGAYFIYLINYWLLKFVRHYKLKYYKLPVLAYINLIFMTAVPIATPFVGFLLVTLMYYSKQGSTLKEKQDN
jgi:hypothetical protein